MNWDTLIAQAKKENISKGELIKFYTKYPHLKPKDFELPKKNEKKPKKR